MTLDLTDEEKLALIRLLRRTIDDERYPLSPRLAPLKAILAKLDPEKPRPELPPPLKSIQGALAQQASAKRSMMAPMRSIGFNTIFAVIRSRFRDGKKGMARVASLPAWLRPSARGKRGQPRGGLEIGPPSQIAGDFSEFGPAPTDPA
jgi:hypothetical protein